MDASDAGAHEISLGVPAFDESPADIRAAPDALHGTNAGLNARVKSVSSSFNSLDSSSLELLERIACPPTFTLRLDAFAEPFPLDLLRLLPTDALLALRAYSLLSLRVTACRSLKPWPWVCPPSVPTFRRYAKSAGKRRNSWTPWTGSAGAA